MIATRNTLSQAIRTKSVALLNRHLSAAIDLHAQLKQAHWNLRGPSFIAVHELFDKLAGEADATGDKLAERAAQLGGPAEGTVQTAAERSFLPPYKLGLANEKDHLGAVAGALAAFGDSVRKAIDEAAGCGDAGTADLFTEISRGVDYDLWLVESHLGHG